MPLSPNDVANKQFSQKMRGYAPDEVDAFLDEVEAELARLLTENARLTQRLAQAATSAPVAVQGGGAGRVSGFPRMTKHGDELLFAWTEAPSGDEHAEHGGGGVHIKGAVARLR